MIVRNSALIRRLLPKNAFIKNIGVLASGSSIAQILTISAAPLMTRLYSPDEFGLLAVYVSIMAILGVLSTMSYELSIPLPDNDKEAARAVELSLMLLASSSIIIGAFFINFSQSLSEMLGAPNLNDLLWFVPLGLLLSGVYRIFTYWSIRNQNYRTIAETKVRQSIIALAIQLAAYKLGVVALIFGQIAGSSVGMFRLARPFLSNFYISKVTLSSLKQVACRYKHFPIYTTWARLINTGGGHMPPLVIAAYFGIGSSGFYLVANRVISLPIGIISSAVSQSYYGEASLMIKDGRVRILTQNLHGLLARASLPPLMFIFLISPDIFHHIFGDGWRGVGEVARWIVFYSYIELLASPFQVFLILDKQRVGLVVQVIMFFIKMSGLLVGAASDNFLSFIQIYSISCFIAYVFVLTVKFVYAKVSFGKAFMDQLRAFLAAVVCVTPVLASMLIDTYLWIKITIGVFSLVLVAAHAIWVIKKYDYVKF